MLNKVTAKAYLLSALALPGAGHLSIKRKTSGYVFILMAVCLLSFFCVGVIAIASDVANKVAAGELPIAQLESQVRTQLQMAMQEGLAFWWWSFWIVWFVALLDLARLHYSQR